MWTNKGGMTFSERIRSGPPPVGTIVSTPSLDVAEVLATSGFDWLFLDLEHGAIGPTEAQQILQAVSGRVPVIARVPENAEVWIKKTLDLGCNGVIVPQVNTADQARAAVRAAKYPPMGERSVGVGRAQGFGTAFTSYVSSANAATSVVVQAEHIDAVSNIESILDVDGIDGVLIGPYDLSGSVGQLGDVAHPDVQRAVRAAFNACKAHDVPVGIFALAADTAKSMLELGYDFVAVGIDMAILANAARQMISETR